MDYKEKILQSARKSIEKKVHKLTKEKDVLKRKVKVLEEQIDVEAFKLRQLI